VRVEACALVLLSSLAASPARAWTEARVRSVSVHLVVAPDASAEVTLGADVRVERGWLEGLELDGLDPDLELRPEARFEDALGEVREAEVESRGRGRIVFAFRRRHAPRRGDYLARVVYGTHLASDVADDGDVRVRWTLPGWRYGLDDVAITIDAPLGAEIARDDTTAEGTVEMARADTEEGTRIVLSRAHLPRTREWSIAIEIPPDRMDEPLRAAPVIAPLVSPAAAAPERAPWARSIAMAALLLALALAKIVAVARSRAAARIDAPRWKVPARAALAIAAAAAS
jgi:hypothetical protein